MISTITHNNRADKQNGEFRDIIPEFDVKKKWHARVQICLHLVFANAVGVL